MKTQPRDLVVLVDASRRFERSVADLIFVPPLRVRRLIDPPNPETTTEEPLVYLIGESEALATSAALLGWLDRLGEEDGAPAALLLPRKGYEWCAAGTHPQFCGVLPCEPTVPIEALERILAESRRIQARRWGEGTVRTASMTWTFSAREAAHPEQAWLFLESVLSGVVGGSTDLSCLGMAFAEALTNAVEHGNLELDSSMKDGSENGLVRFFEERERRLADPRYGRRRVQVSADLKGSRIRVRIRNQGRGFDPGSRTRRTKAEQRFLGAHGLGLDMIESLVDHLSLSPDGRTVTLTHTIPRGRIRPEVVPVITPTDDEYPAAA